jgi:4-amino-4-deoxy-L-arabinose transferase-like glycosyltransferase
MKPRLAERVAIGAVLLLTAVLGSRGISDPASVMLGGDMSRYMMNGVFVYDWIRDGGTWTLADLTTYAERYFARYPALTLGHHPPIPYLAVVPFYAVFGISVFAARLTALCWFVLASWALFLVGRRLFDWRVGAWAAALFSTNVMVLRAGQHLLSEMPATALVLLALAALLGWRDTRRGSYLVAFVALATASLLAKQLTALVVPVYAIVGLASLGWRRLATRHAAIAAIATGAVTVPLVVVSARLAPANVALLRDGISTLWAGSRPQSLDAVLRTIVTTHLAWPALIAVAVGAVVGLGQYRRRLTLLAGWIAAVLTGTVVLIGPVEPARYAFGALPVYYLLAAAPAGAWLSAPLRVAVSLGLAMLLVWQGWGVRYVRPSGAGGYEEAAMFVAANSRQPVVLYHAVVDTGYFVFFTRVHDPSSRMVVLRGEKLLVAPHATDATSAHELRGILQRHGVQYVVLEEREAETAVLRRLHDVVRGDGFAERRRIPIRTREPGTAGVDLAIYEYFDAGPADPDAVVDIGVWRANRRITVPIRDLGPRRMAPENSGR